MSLKCTAWDYSERIDATKDVTVYLHIIDENSAKIWIDAEYERLRSNGDILEHTVISHERWKDIDVSISKKYFSGNVSGKLSHMDTSFEIDRYLGEFIFYMKLEPKRFPSHPHSKIEGDCRKVSKSNMPNPDELQGYKRKF